MRILRQRNEAAKERKRHEKESLAAGSLFMQMERRANMSTKKIGGNIITLDGEKEFRAATSACNKSLATMKSEMKLVEAQTTGTANTLETLQKKHDVLSRTLDEQVKKEEAVRTGLKHAKNSMRKSEVSWMHIKVNWNRPEAIWKR